MRVMRISPVSVNSNSNNKKNSLNPSFGATVKMPDISDLEKTMYFYAPETRAGMVNTFKNLKDHFEKVGSDFLNISMGIFDNSICSNSGSHILGIRANFKPIDKAVDYLLKKHKYVISEKQYKKLAEKKPYLLDALERGDYIYYAHIAEISNTDANFSRKALIKPDFPARFEKLVKESYPEDSEALFFKNIIKNNTGFNKFIKDWWLS